MAAAEAEDARLAAKAQVDLVAVKLFDGHGPSPGTLSDCGRFNALADRVVKLFDGHGPSLGCWLTRALAPPALPGLGTPRTGWRSYW